MDPTQTLLPAKEKGRACKPAFWWVLFVTMIFWTAFAGKTCLRNPDLAEDSISEKENSKEDKALADVSILEMAIQDLSSELLDFKSRVQNTGKAKKSLQNRRRKRQKTTSRRHADDSLSATAVSETMRKASITRQRDNSSPFMRFEFPKHEVERSTMRLERMTSSEKSSNSREISLFAHPTKGRKGSIGTPLAADSAAQKPSPTPPTFSGDLNRPEPEGGHGHDRLSTPSPDKKGGEYKFTDGAGPGPGESSGSKEGYTFVESVDTHSGHIKMLKKDRTGMQLLDGDVWKPGWGWTGEESELVKDPRYKDTGWDSLDSSMKMEWLGDEWRKGWGWHTKGDDGQYPPDKRLLRRELSKSMAQ